MLSFGAIASQILIDSISSEYIMPGYRRYEILMLMNLHPFYFANEEELKKKHESFDLQGMGEKFDRFAWCSGFIHIQPINTE